MTSVVQLIHILLISCFPGLEEIKINKSDSEQLITYIHYHSVVIYMYQKWLIREKRKLYRQGETIISSPNHLKYF